MSSHARIRMTAPAAAPAKNCVKVVLNPLWVITIGMGVFFAATALLMMFD